MRFEIPKILERFRMDEYALEFGDATVTVWVNPPVKMLQEFQAQQVDDALEILSALWSQGLETWSVEDIRILAESSADTDPALLPWMVRRTLQLIAEHRKSVKKNWSRE